jgi:hypothetical protein
LEERGEAKDTVQDETGSLTLLSSPDAGFHDFAGRKRTNG